MREETKEVWPFLVSHTTLFLHSYSYTPVHSVYCLVYCCTGYGWKRLEFDKLYKSKHISARASRCTGSTVPWTNLYHDDSMQDELHTLRLSHVVSVAVSCNISTRPVAICWCTNVRIIISLKHNSTVLVLPVLMHGYRAVDQTARYSTVH